MVVVQEWLSGRLRWVVDVGDIAVRGGIVRGDRSWQVWWQHDVWSIRIWPSTVLMRPISLAGGNGSIAQVVIKRHVSGTKVRVAHGQLNPSGSDARPFLGRLDADNSGKVELVSVDVNSSQILAAIDSRHEFGVEGYCRSLAQQQGRYNRFHI